jgi:SH3 domain protein
MRCFLLVFGACIAIFAISDLLFAQEFPYEGTVTGDKVNLRADAGEAHKSLTKMPKGAKITVVGKKEVAGKVWLEVELPQDVFLYISQKYVQKKEEKGNVLPGVVKTEEPAGKVAVRTGVETDDVVLGYVHNGDIITIRGTRDTWYNIFPPKGFTGWISSDFVKGITPQPAPSLSEEETQLEELRKRRDEIDKQIDILTKEKEKIDKDLEERERKRNELEEQIGKLTGILLAREKRMEEIDREHQERVKRAGIKEYPAKRYVAEGIVDDFGKLINKPPASHRLRVSEDGDIRYYLESVDPSIDLRHYLGKRVGVNGEIQKRKWGDKEIEVIKVESIAILED